MYSTNKGTLVARSTQQKLLLLYFELLILYLPKKVLIIIYFFEGIVFKLCQYVCHVNIIFSEFASQSTVICFGCAAATSRGRKHWSSAVI